MLCVPDSQKVKVRVKRDYLFPYQHRTLRSHQLIHPRVLIMLIGEYREQKLSIPQARLHNVRIAEAS